MSKNILLTNDQRIQVADIAANMMGKHCADLTSLNLLLSAHNKLTGISGAPDSSRELDEFRQIFKWFYDTVSEQVIAEADSPE